jgi:hypothetical protein
MPTNLTEQQLFDYIFCPAKYDLKYNKKIIIEDSFSINNILNKVSKYFYLYVVNNMKTPTMNMISSKFDSLMKPYMDITSNKQYTDALFQLRNFYNWACSNQIAVIDSDVRYVIRHKETIIEGVMNPIAINKNKKLEFLIMNFSSRIPDQLELDTKLKYSIDMMSFNSSNRDNKIYATKMHCVKSSKDFVTSRTDNDYNRLLSTIEGVTTGITNKAFYPRESHMCNNCTYRSLCRGWK